MTTVEEGSGSKKSSSIGVRIALALLVVAVLAGLVYFGLSGTKGGSSAGAGAHDDMAMIPAEAAMGFHLNLAELRKKPIWKSLLELQKASPETESMLADLRDTGGIDLFKQVETAFFAYPLPAATAEATRSEFGVILHGGPFDEERLSNWSRERMKKQGLELGSRDFLGKKLYSDGSEGGAESALLDTGTAIAGGRQWIEKMIELSQAAPGAGPPAADKRPELAPLLARVNTKGVLWGVSLVPESVRKQLAADPRTAGGASWKSVFAGCDIDDKGLSLKGAALLGSEADAKSLASSLKLLVTAFKLNPQVAATGLLPMLEGIQITPKGSEIEFDILLKQAQVDDLIARLQILLGTQGFQARVPIPNGGDPGVRIPPPPSTFAPMPPATRPPPQNFPGPGTPSEAPSEPAPPPDDPRPGQ